MTLLVAVGACYLDTILRRVNCLTPRLSLTGVASVPHYPAEDSKLRAIELIRRRGGNCPNTLEVLQQLVELDTAVGTESHGLVLCSVLPSSGSVGAREIRSSLHASIDLQHCIHRDGCSEPASSYIIRSLATDSRTIVNHNDLPEMTAEEFIPIADELGEATVWYHFEGRIPDVSLRCIKHLRRAHPSVHISVELEKPGRDGLHEMAAEADVVFYSKTWAQTLGYEQPQDFLRSQAPFAPKASILFCTWAERGAAALQLPACDFMHVPAYTAGDSQIVDTVGAGDTFIAGSLFCMLRHAYDWTLVERLRFANEIAGRKVVQEGFAGLGKRMTAFRAKEL